MTDEQLATVFQQKSRRVLDLDISAHLLAERLIGEILGWDLVDWPTVLPHQGRKFSFGRQRQRIASIHDQLKPHFDRCDPSRHDFSPLRPSPVVNDNLSRLVGHLCRHIGRHGVSDNDEDSPALERTEAQDRLHLAVIELFLGRIDEDAELRLRAERLKRIAAAAENELEKHFADLINDRLESSFLQGALLDWQKIKSLRDQAESRIAETRALNEEELAGLSMPVLSLDDEALIRIEMAKILLSRFPYLRNYELMMLAELRMLQQPLVPRFVRERDLAGEAGSIDRPLLARWDKALTGFSLQDPRSTLDPGPSQTLVVCGSGPLPLSALFLHLFTGAAMVLVDADASAIERSGRLIGNLERLTILEPGALTMRKGDVGQLAFHAPGTPTPASAEASIACDGVMIASLVDQDAKARITAQFQCDPNAPNLLIMRSAIGLSAKLVYDAIPTKTFSQGNLAYCGETIPAAQVATHLDRIEAIQRKVASVTSPNILAIAHPDVVNTTEVYRRILSGAATSNVNAEPCETIEEWIEKMERFPTK